MSGGLEFELKREGAKGFRLYAPPEEEDPDEEVEAEMSAEELQHIGTLLALLYPHGGGLFLHLTRHWLRLVEESGDANRSRWPTDPVWQVVQAAPFTEAPSKARRLIRREQHVHAVEQLDAGAYGYLVSRTALLHPKGETFDVSMGLRGFFDALTKIAAQPDKDFGELVRQRRRKRGLPVAPVGQGACHSCQHVTTILPSMLRSMERLSASCRRLFSVTNCMLREYDWPSSDCAKRSLRLKLPSGVTTRPSALLG